MWARRSDPVFWILSEFLRSANIGECRWNNRTVQSQSIALELEYCVGLDALCDVL